MQVSSSSIHSWCRLDVVDRPNLLSIGSSSSNRFGHAHVRRKAFTVNPIRSLPSEPCSTTSTVVAAAATTSNSPFINGLFSRGNLSRYNDSLSFLVSQRKGFISLSSGRKMRKKRVLVVSAVFEKFTERAIKAILFSQREAQALGKEVVFTQHLLLGLIAEEDSSPDGFLASGITLDKTREAVRSIWHLKDSSSVTGTNDDGNDKKAVSVPFHHVPFSINAKRVFEAAVEYSKTLGHNFIAPEHIAVALFRVDDGNASRVLRRYYIKSHNILCLGLLLSLFQQ